MLTDKELTLIYNEASGLEPKRLNPITTQRVFAAMRATAAAEAETTQRILAAMRATAAAELEACLEIVAKYESDDANSIYNEIEIRLGALAPRREGDV